MSTWGGGSSTFGPPPLKMLRPKPPPPNWFTGPFIRLTISSNNWACFYLDDSVTSPSLSQGETFVSFSMVYRCLEQSWRHWVSWWCFLRETCSFRIFTAEILRLKFLSFVTENSQSNFCCKKSSTTVSLPVTTHWPRSVRILVWRDKKGTVKRFRKDDVSLFSLAFQFIEFLTSRHYRNRKVEKRIRLAS